MKINLKNKIRYKIEVNCPEFISGWIFSKSTSLKIINLEINKKIISFSKIDQLREDVNTAYKINKSLGAFIEGKYNKYWNREWHDFSFGINYVIF